VLRFRPNYYYVAGASGDFLPIDNHRRATREQDAGFGIVMLMKARSFPWLKVAL
jgi:hypothetical protein